MIYVLNDIDNEICLACREIVDGYTDMIAADSTHFNDLPLVPLADADDMPIDARYIIICDTADEFQMMMDE